MSEVIEGSASNGTFVRQSAPATIYATSAKAKSNVTNFGGANSYTYLYTNLPAGMDADTTVVSAYLTITMTAASGSRTLSLQRHAKPTTPYSKMTWNNKPGTLSGSSARTKTQSSAITEWTFDVTADVQAVASGGKFYGWRLTTTAAVSPAWKMLGWGSTTPPRLVVTLDNTPSAPDNLGPDGIVSLEAPMFTWLPANDLASAQLQIDEVAGDFSSPLWDSGTVATSLAQLDSDALGWTGLADGASVIARVRQTTDGGTSEWSDDVTVTREVKPSLVIDTPLATTEDPSPTAQWTTTDQVRYQVTLASAGKLIHDSGVIAGADAAYQFPKGAKRAGEVLTTTVTVWDSEDRVASPGDPVYIRAAADSTYTPGTADPVDDLAAVQNGVSPWVELAWSRVEIPDEYLVLRDGEIIARFDGLDDDSEHANSYTDWTCPPNTDVTYNVVPVIEGAAGDDGPGAVVRTQVTGAWVIDPETGVHFSITGDSLSIVYAESAVTYTPLGAPAPLKRTFALRGLEGSVGGTLADYDDRTVAELEADLFTIKAAADDTFRFVEGDVNIPVLVSDLTTMVNPELSFARPYPMPRSIRKTVSFTIAQVGELPFAEVSP